MRLELALSIAALAVGAPISAADASWSSRPDSFVSGPGPVATDTIVDVRRGDRVVLRNLSGEISVETWDRDVIEVRSDEGDGVLEVRRSGSTIEVTRDDGKGRRRRSVEASIRVPAWIDFVAGGQSLELVVDGIEGSVEVRNVNGDIWVRNAGGPVEIRTVEGEIDVSGARSGVTASSQSDEVRLREVSGPISVHSGSGDVQLIGIRSSSVRAETQDGDIDFSGTIEDGGDYRFFTHDGDATIAIPSDTNARVAVSTFDGEFESEFPVRLERFTGGREFDFTVGDGSGAHIEIQVFDGEIQILRRR